MREKYVWERFEPALLAIYLARTHAAAITYLLRFLACWATVTWSMGRLIPSWVKRAPLQSICKDS